jgi:DNA repair protein RadA/Sms
MTKAKKQYVCQTCGAITPRWVGKCESCQAWNSISEETTATVVKGLSRSRKAVEYVNLDAQLPDVARYLSGIQEFDRVCGGGLVPGSVILIGGDPGIGKSTLLLQTVSQLSENYKCVYISGEEAVNQICLRASRLGVAKSSVSLAASTNVREILRSLPEHTPQVVVFDSIQTLFVDELDAAPGTVSQVRACSHEILQAAKAQNFTAILVGHVTKDGAIAGPRVLEHMVDAVLYFEGERGHQFRILRSVKNRFGPTNEIGVFEMATEGLREVSNPSSLFLSDRIEPVSGSVVYAGMEGTRPLMVELEALLAPTNYATPKRTVVGWDNSRLSMIIAVLEARCGLSLNGYDIYLNVAGGYKIIETGADLAVAAALISALTGRILPNTLVVCGEVGLSGEVRPVGHMEQRLNEAAKLGFESAITSPLKKGETGQLSVQSIPLLRELVDCV